VLHYSELIYVQWEEEIPNILRKDMKSLAEESTGASEGGVRSKPLNLQERVIESGS
jgi:hypothetical protein